MGGGIPAGSLTLVEGGSGAGKSVLTQQIISGALNDGFTVTLFTSENTIKSLMRQMNSIDLDVTDYLLMGLLHVYPMELSGLEEEAPRQLLEAMRSEEDHEVLVIDSFTSAVSSASDAAIVNFFENSKRLCAQGHSIMLTLHGSAIDDDMLNPLRGMCDAHLRLRTEQDGQKLIKTLEVAKVRGAASVTGAIVGFDVEPGWGMRVVPISKARG
jgi:flagellar protein FlaH